MKKKRLNFEKLELISDVKLRTFKGGKSSPIADPVTLNTLTVPEGTDDGDDGIKND
ncbi:hypothetical protein [Sphingobacterium detergens]|uniref:Uncharacterized protein n=1 Tax=Sphingobacterium detergens TaxID=1145106 RepID=A0A420AQU0_SPHD1|nr:hypothetical protein [Sphingobacterium detergens]RKE46832.1 hypothetical protein DFQ12_3987 [Sphingobacterium detergens]